MTGASQTPGPPRDLAHALTGPEIELLLGVLVQGVVGEGHVRLVEGIRVPVGVLERLGQQSGEGGTLLQLDAVVRVCCRFG